MGAFYLQISKVLVAMLLATSPNQWDIPVMATKYRHVNGDTIYVAEKRWIDSVLQGIVLDSTSTGGIDTELDIYSVKVVYLSDSSLVKENGPPE